MDTTITLSKHETVVDRDYLKQLEETKSLLELNCYIYFKWNNTLEVWNGCLTKFHGKDHTYSDRGVPNHIKSFMYATQAESMEAATKWANNNPRKLSNYKGK